MVRRDRVSVRSAVAIVVVIHWKLMTYGISLPASSSGRMVWPQIEIRRSTRIMLLPAATLKCTVIATGRATVQYQWIVLLEWII